MHSAFLKVCTIAACCVACSAPKHIYFGEQGSKNFDSSDISISRKDRLAYVSFLGYETTDHHAGRMSSESEVSSLGIFAPSRTNRYYAWLGNFIFSSGTDSSLTRYFSYVDDEEKGDYAAVSLGKLLGAKRQSTSERNLTVRGTIYQPRDSATFFFFNSDDVVTFISGYMLHQGDSVTLEYIDNAASRHPKTAYKKYGNGLYLNGEMIAALDLNNTPKKAYLSKNLQGSFKSEVLAYLAVVTGNYGIVPRRSTILKTIW